MRLNISLVEDDYKRKLSLVEDTEELNMSHAQNRASSPKKYRSLDGEENSGCPPPMQSLVKMKRG